MQKTEKLYYQKPFLTNCEATVVDIQENRLCLDRTIAYPEGGGQIADIGSISINNTSVPFVNTLKGVGRVFSVSDFPTVNVDTPVFHFVADSDIAKFSIGDTVEVHINAKRRILATVHHSAIHLALMFASQKRGDLYRCIKGCSITEENARLDFALSERFTESDIEFIYDSVNEIVALNEDVLVYPHEQESEAWYWKCRDYVCPCGGTHVQKTGQIGHVSVKRKGIGKGRERLIVEVNNPVLSETDYQ